jgi:DNA-directed RNA polymerase sigma subunit (sigma70/sigma32)
MSRILDRAIALQKRDRQIVRAARKARSLAEVAREFGLTRARVSQIVNGAAYARQKQAEQQ